MRNSNQADDESVLFDLGCPTWLWENDKRQQQRRRRLSFLRVAASFRGRDVFSHSALPQPPRPHPHPPLLLPRTLHGLIWQREMRQDGNQHARNKTESRIKEGETASCRSSAPSFLASFASILSAACRAPGDDCWPPQPSSPKHIYILKDLHKIHKIEGEPFRAVPYLFPLLRTL